MNDYTFQEKRRFLLKCLLASQIPLISGCPAILRLFIGRSTLRAFRRGQRNGGYSSLVTIGRGMSSVARMYRLYNNLNQSSQILDLEGRHIARVNTENNIIKCFDKNQNTVIATTVRDDFFLHYDFRGEYIGRSHQEHDDKTKHFDFYGNFSGYDLIFESDNFIEHFDKKSRSLGKSKIKKDVDGSILYADKALNETINSLNDNNLFKCKEANTEYKRFRELQTLCDNNKLNACQEKKFSYAKIQRILKNGC